MIISSRFRDNFPGVVLRPTNKPVFSVLGDTIALGKIICRNTICPVVHRRDLELGGKKRHPGSALDGVERNVAYCGIDTTVFDDVT